MGREMFHKTLDVCALVKVLCLTEARFRMHDVVPVSWHRMVQNERFWCWGVYRLANDGLLCPVMVVYS